MPNMSVYRKKTNRRKRKVLQCIWGIFEKECKNDNANMICKMVKEKKYGVTNISIQETMLTAKKKDSVYRRGDGQANGVKIKLITKECIHGQMYLYLLKK